jgi:hypothetical protein
VRQFAQPKSRKARTALGLGGDEDIDMEFENVEASLVVGSASDFEEADFLASGEVAMGGV